MYDTRTKNLNTKRFWFWKLSIHVSFTSYIDKFLINLTDYQHAIMLYLVSPSAFAIWPNTCAKLLGVIPRSSGTVRTPSIVNVLPVPVWPYANIVPEYNTISRLHLIFIWAISHLSTRKGHTQTFKSLVTTSYNHYTTPLYPSRTHSTIGRAASL